MSLSKIHKNVETPADKVWGMTSLTGGKIALGIYIIQCNISPALLLQMYYEASDTHIFQSIVCLYLGVIILFSSSSSPPPYFELLPSQALCK